MSGGKNIFSLIMRCVAGAALAVLLIYLPFGMSRSNQSLMIRIFVYAVYGMSYDILKGYTGFLSIGHALFFGGGMYITGIFFTMFGATFPILALAMIAAALFASVCGYLMGRLSFRASGLVATMITLALGEIVRNMAERWRAVTGGSDGLNFKVPQALMDRVTLYFIALAFLALMFFLLYKFVRSPVGRVLQSIRENEQRSIFLGYNTMNYKLIAMQVSGITAALAGVLFALSTRFVYTEYLGIGTTMHPLLYTLLGGEGTLIGPVIGSLVVNLFQSFLLRLNTVHPIFEKWPIFFGSLYVVVVLLMPEGVTGVYRRCQALLLSRGAPRKEVN